MSDLRSRNWTFLVYPDSAPEDWRDILDSYHLSFVISPLHDKDINDDGTLKKPHYHVVVLFGGVKSYDQVYEIVYRIKGARPERVHNIKAMIRYLTHLDNPEKYQYSASDIITLGCVDLSDLLKPSASERHAIIGDMYSWCVENNITEYCDFSDYARVNHTDDWWPVLVDGAYHQMSTLIASIRYKKRDELRKTDFTMIDKNTGEIIEG